MLHIPPEFVDSDPYGFTLLSQAHKARSHHGTMMMARCYDDIFSGQLLQYEFYMVFHYKTMEFPCRIEHTCNFFPATLYKLPFGSWVSWRKMCKVSHVLSSVCTLSWLNLVRRNKSVPGSEECIHPGDVYLKLTQFKSFKAFIRSQL